MIKSEKIQGQSVFRFAHQAMGTTFELLVSGKEETYSRQASQAVFSEIDRIENLFSRFNPCSDIGQINHLKPGQSLLVGVETYECLKTVASIQSQTRGAFDVNIGSLVKYKEEDAPTFQKLNTGIMEIIDLSLTSQGYMVKIRQKEAGIQEGHIQLDLGGIGKGYALDKTLEILSDWDIDSALIHGGTSSALAVGVPADSPAGDKGWPVGIGGTWECAQSPKEFFLKDRALSGSGTEVKGKHIIDPRIGGPAQGHLATWVSHPSAAVSDALSTAFMVMDTKEVKAFCDSHPEVWALVVIDPQNCQVFNKDVAIQ
ncbi:MAG: FAD:protein FMN transferase [Candidatus Aminicenantes bacterium]|nr:MAG: FAD:protein FMN transferase [Candidatus Aminicenantes bacterium]